MSEYMDNLTADDKIKELTAKGKLPTIQVHMLVPYGPTLLNRDITGHQKTIMMDKRRMRISSQAQKTVLRDFMLKSMPKHGFRTRDAVDAFTKFYKDAHPEKEDAEIKAFTEMMKKLIQHMSSNDKGDGDKKAQILYYSDADIHEMIQTVEKLLEDEAQKDDTKKDKGKKSKGEKDETKISAKHPAIVALAESTLNRGIDMDTAFFGRMSTAKYLRTIPSAIRFAHAYSVTEMYDDVDDFTATDDCSKLLDSWDSGSAHMAENDINSALFYKYYSINYRTLVKNLLMCEQKDVGDDRIEELCASARHVVAEFIENSIRIHPSGHQNSMASMPMPIATYIEVSDGFECTADTAFSRCLDRENAEENSIKRLRDFVNDDTFRLPNEIDRKGFWLTAPWYKDLIPEGTYQLTDIVKLIEEGTYVS